MLKYCQLDPKEHISMKFNLKFKYFQSRKMHLNMSSAKWWPFFPGEMSWQYTGRIFRPSSLHLVKHQQNGIPAVNAKWCNLIGCGRLALLGFLFWFRKAEKTTLVCLTRCPWTSYTNSDYLLTSIKLTYWGRVLYTCVSKMQHLWLR